MKKPDRKQKQGVALMDCIDAVHENWHALHTVAGLLESCRHTPVADLEPEVIGHAGRLMLDELTRMHDALERLEKKIATS
jgi:hypothetical protein